MPHDESMAHLRQLLADSVRRQLISDVPVGAFLSGGIDSRIMVGLMAEAAHKPVKTFTVVFEGHGLEYYNEREGARQAAERFGTEHHEMVVQSTSPKKCSTWCDISISRSLTQQLTYAPDFAPGAW